MRENHLKEVPKLLVKCAEEVNRGFFTWLLGR